MNPDEFLCLDADEPADIEIEFISLLNEKERKLWTSICYQTFDHNLSKLRSDFFQKDKDRLLKKYYNFVVSKNELNNTFKSKISKSNDCKIFSDKTFIQKNFNSEKFLKDNENKMTEKILFSSDVDFLTKNRFFDHEKVNLFSSNIQNDGSEVKIKEEKSFSSSIGENDIENCQIYSNEMCHSKERSNFLKFNDRKVKSESILEMKSVLNTQSCNFDKVNLNLKFLKKINAKFLENSSLDEFLNILLHALIHVLDETDFIETYTAYLLILNTFKTK